MHSQEPVQLNPQIEEFRICASSVGPVVIIGSHLREVERDGDNFTECNEWGYTEEGDLLFFNEDEDELLIPIEG